jgi:glycosyltransferase involved in cell wall biosynthesis
MKICLVLSDLTYPPREGLHQQSILLARALHEHGFNVTVTGFYRDPKNLDRQALMQEEAIDYRGVEISPWVSYIEFAVRARCGALKHTHRIAKRRLEAFLANHDFDVVHFDGLPAASLGRKCNAPKVLSLIDPGSRRQWRAALQARSLRQRALSFAMSLAHLLIEFSMRGRDATWHVVSPEDRAFLSRVHRRQPCVSIPVMYEPAEKTTSLGPERGTRTSSDALTIVVYADLRQSHMREAFRRLMLAFQNDDTSFEFIVLGRVTESEELIGHTRHLRVRYIAWAQEPASVMQDGDVVVLPDTLGTGLKNRAIQAMATGTTVVGTSVAFEGLPVASGSQVFVVKAPEEIPEALKTLKSSPNLRRKVGIAGRAFVESRYTTQRVAEEWAAVYEGLLAVPPAVCQDRDIE